MQAKEITRLLLIAGLSSAINPLAQGEGQPDPSAKTEKIEVTGTNIRRTSIETASPVQILTAEDIRKTGVTSVSDLMRTIPAMGSGTLDDLNPGSGFSRGSSTAGLRGMGSSGTLMLLNGRRMAPAAFADPNTGQSTQYNLNNIPLSAIERVEVLKDGASAIYGSDAIAGVVNFILKKDYTGAEAYVNRTGNGDFGTETARATLGIGALGADKYNVMATFEHVNRQATSTDAATGGIEQSKYLYSDNRLWPLVSANSSPANFFMEKVLGNGTFNSPLPVSTNCPANQISNQNFAIGGVAGPTTCRYDTYANYNEVAPQKRDSLLTHASYEISDNLSGWAELSYARSATTYIAPSPSISSSGTTWFALDGTKNFYQLILSPTNPQNPLFQANPNNQNQVALAYRFADISQSQNVVLDDTRASFGLKGTDFVGWDWESALVYDKNTRSEVDNGFLSYPGLSNAVANNQYVFGGSNSPSVLAQISPSVNNQGDSTSTLLDTKGSREIGQLSGGPIGLALGAEIRHDTLDLTPDAKVVSGQMIGVGSSMANGNRTILSAYGEFNLPVLPSLNLEIAGRYDHYSDYGNSTTPKLGFKWTPTETIAFRGTYAEGFRAPSLSQISSSSVQSFNSGIYDPLRCADNVNPVSQMPNECSSGISIASRITANANLQPETAKSYTFGFIFAPTASISASADLYQIDRKNEIDRLDSQYLIDQVYAFNNPQYTSQIIRNPNPSSWVIDNNGNPIPGSGPIQGTIREFFNLGESQTRGIDLDASFRNSLGELGKLITRISANYLIFYKHSEFGGDTLQNYEGGEDGVSGNELPRARAMLTSTLEKGPWAFSGTLNYTGGYYAGDPVNGCYATLREQAVMANCTVSSWKTLDAGIKYKGIKNLTLHAVIRNLQNRAAPYDPGYVTYGYNPSLANPYGRIFSFGATYKFQ